MLLFTNSALGDSKTDSSAQRAACAADHVCLSNVSRCDPNTSCVTKVVVAFAIAHEDSAAQIAACLIDRDCSTVFAACRQSTICASRAIAQCAAERTGAAATVANAALSDADAVARATALADYKADSFETRIAEMCAVTPVIGAIPLQGGHEWIFNGQGETTAIACSYVKMAASPLPRSILRGTEMASWQLVADRNFPESVQLLDGIPQRLVTALAIGPKAKRETNGPCYEPDPAIICEGSEGAAFIAATRQLEATVRTMDSRISQNKLEGLRAIMVLAGELGKVANEGQKEMASNAIVKTSESSHQSKKEFEKRIVAVLGRRITAMNAYIAAKEAGPTTH